MTSPSGSSPNAPVIAIVGGGGGIGRGIARAFARRGFRLALLDFDPGRLDAARQALSSPTSIATYPLDVTRDEQVADVIGRLLDDQGRLDVLAHAAGLTQVSPFAETRPEVMRRVLDVNVLGVISVTRAALPALVASRGRIVALSSVCGFAPLWGRTGYCASKYALHGFCETLRCELAPDGVSVTLVCPSFVDTDFATRGLAGDGTRLASERVTTGRAVDPEALGEAIYRAAQRRKRLLLVPRSAALSYWLSRFVPRFYERLMSRRFAKGLLREEKPSS